MRVWHSPRRNCIAAATHAANTGDHRDHAADALLQKPIAAGRTEGQPQFSASPWVKAPWARAPSSTPSSTPTARRAPRPTSARRPRAARRPPPKRKRPSRRRSAPPAARKAPQDVRDVECGTARKNANGATGAHTETIVRELRKSAAGKYATRTGALKRRRRRSWRNEGVTRGSVASVVGQRLLLESCKVDVLVVPVLI